jgi:hypothetical protein
MKKKMNFFAMSVLATFLMLTVSSCDSEPVDQRPELPPVESMMMDFSDFSEEPAGQKGSANTYTNFLYSYVNVGFWNLAVTLTSALPVAAYGHALQQTPEYLGDNTWEWSYEFPLNGLNYSATLTGKRISNEEFSVEMVIADASAPNAGVKWFDGMVRYDHTQADWTFYKDGTISVLEVGWNMDFESEAADLTYTYTEPGKAETGSSIMWEYIPGNVFDAAYTISMAGGTSDIEWNITTIEGRVMAPVFFGDDLWHCWDSQANGLADKVCD